MAHKYPTLLTLSILYWTVLCPLTTFSTRVNAFGSCFVQFYIQKLIMAMQIWRNPIELSNCVDTSPPPFALLFIVYDITSFIKSYEEISYLTCSSEPFQFLFLNLLANWGNWNFHTFRDWPFKNIWYRVHLSVRSISHKIFQKMLPWHWHLSVTMV